MKTPTPKQIVAAMQFHQAYKGVAGTTNWAVGIVAAINDAEDANRSPAESEHPKDQS